MAIVVNRLRLIREVGSGVVHIRRPDRNWYRDERSLCRDRPFRTLTGTLPDGRSEGTLADVTCDACKRRFDKQQTA